MPKHWPLGSSCSRTAASLETARPRRDEIPFFPNGTLDSEAWYVNSEGCGVPKFGARPKKSMISRQDVSFGTSQAGHDAGPAAQAGLRKSLKGKRLPSMPDPSGVTSNAGTARQDAHCS
jgi:hypothetical protein